MRSIMIEENSVEEVAAGGKLLIGVPAKEDSRNGRCKVWNCARKTKKI